MSPKLKYLIMFMLAGLSPASFADAEEDRDALRIEVENLLQYGRLSIGDVDIASGELLAEFYERRDYAPAWTDKEQIAELISAIKATAGDGDGSPGMRYCRRLPTTSATCCKRVGTRARMLPRLRRSEVGSPGSTCHIAVEIE